MRASHSFGKDQMKQIVTSLVAVMIMTSVIMGCVEPSATDGQPQATGSAVPPPPALPGSTSPRKVAKTGVGKKTRNLEGLQGLVVTPVNVYFRAQEMIVFKIQIPNAVRNFKAFNNRSPDSHEEYMSKIIEAGRIALPELPTGARYVYDPGRQELMVEHPP